MHSQLEEIVSRRIKAPSKRAEFAVRTIESVLALAALILLAPVLFCCALLVKITSPGTILFRQKRVGLGGQIFTLYKFRTMAATVGDSLPITAGSDPRITALGRVLRRSKLDELPQLYNVWRGEMSFVGPRPESVELVDWRNPLWRKVLSVRPGITDPVTLEFRNEEALLAGVENKTAFYSEVIQPYKLNGYTRYLETKSMKNDVWIVVQTLRAILFPQTAVLPTGIAKAAGKNVCDDRLS